MREVALGVERADPAARRRAVAWTLIAAALGAVLLILLAGWQPRVQAWLIADADDSGERIAWVTGAVAIVLIAPLFAFAGYLWSIATRIARSRRFPPPGMRVVRDTMILEGPAAERRARVLRALALVLIVAASGLAVLFLRLATMLG